MEHVLDNPAWNALLSGNSNLANGDKDVKYFSPDVSPFVGLRENSTENFNKLNELIPHQNPVGFIADKEIESFGPWKFLACIRCLQMVYDSTAPPGDNGPELVTLTDADVPQMLALTKLTNPGPFASRTIDFDHYRGIFDGDKLVAMAGQRLHVFDYAEISAVCTHPGYLGRGYAKQLLLYHAHRIQAAGGKPMLHVRHDNERAIKVYESLGFVTRRELNFYFIKK